MMHSIPYISLYILFKYKLTLQETNDTEITNWTNQASCLIILVLVRHQLTPPATAAGMRRRTTNNAGNKIYDITDKRKIRYAFPQFQLKHRTIGLNRYLNITTISSASRKMVELLDDLILCGKSSYLASDNEQSNDLIACKHRPGQALLQGKPRHQHDTDRMNLPHESPELSERLFSMSPPTSLLTTLPPCFWCLRSPRRV